VLLGVLALLVTLFLPKGLWGLISGNGRFQLFPTGYKLVNVPSAPTTKQDGEASGA